MREFSADDVEHARCTLERFSRRFSSALGQQPESALFYALIRLSGGTLKGLRQQINAALLDYREVLWTAQSRSAKRRGAS